SFSLIRWGGPPAFGLASTRGFRQNTRLVYPPPPLASGSCLMTNPLGELAFVAGYNGSKDPASAKKPFSATHTTLTVVPSAPVEPEQKDYFVERDGLKFAGTHLIIDL